MGPVAPFFFMTLNTSMANSGGGYGVVFRCASHHCDAFHAYTRLDCADVEELLPGTKVLLLPHTPADSGWAPVVVSDRAGGARFTWHHPECIKLFALSDLGGKVTVGHLLERGRSSPSHNITTQRCGVSRTESHGLLLDARWEEDVRGSRDTSGCSGWCTCVCVETASLQNRVADILEFASWGESGVVVCERGKHRSLSAAHILQLFFHRDVDYRYASTRRACRCGRPAVRHIESICDAFRSLPNRTRPENLLSTKLELPARR